MSKYIKPKNRGYSEAGASLTRRALKGFNPNSSSAHEDIEQNNHVLRQRSRMLYMAAPMATSAVNTNRTKVVGTGLVPSPTIDFEFLHMTAEQASEWQKRTLREFKIWSDKRENCDALGINDFSELQQLAMKSWLMSGDVFALIKREEPTKLKPYSLRIHLIEADRVCTPYKIQGLALYNTTEGIVPEGQPGAGNKIYDGVEVDKSGKIVAYHVCNVYPQATLKESASWTRVPAVGEKTGLPNVLQLMESERPEAYRGVPYLAQVIEPMLQARRYTESELMAAIIQSYFTAWIETASDPTEIPFNEVGSGDVDGLPQENPSEAVESENEYEMSPGTVIHLEPGESVHFGNPNIPTAGFETFMKAIARQCGAALEIPYDVLMKEFNSSYSASRGALLEAWEGFKMRRQWFVSDFCQPVYEMWLAEAVARGRVKAPGFFDDPAIRAAWCGAKWIGPVQGQLDPRKEVDSSLALANSGVKTYEQITRELGGGDWNENINKVIQEKKKLAESAAIYNEILSSGSEVNTDEE